MKLSDAIAIAATAAAFAYMFNAYLDHAQSAAVRHDTVLLQLMGGGIPAVAARCLLETQHAWTVMDCVEAGAPTKKPEGRAL